MRSYSLRYHGYERSLPICSFLMFRTSRPVRKCPLFFNLLTRAFVYLRPAVFHIAWLSPVPFRPGPTAEFDLAPEPDCRDLPVTVAEFGAQQRLPQHPIRLLTHLADDEFLCSDMLQLVVSLMRRMFSTARPVRNRRERKAV